MYRTEVSFGKKLGRLTLGAVQEPPKARSRPAANLPPVGGADAPLPARVLLDDLRAKMDAILSRAPVTRAPATLDAPELPFVTEVTALGDLHRRVVRFPLSHRVGHKSVGPAHSADAELLALLALDPSIARASPAGALYLDTETTGLAGGAGTVAFLVGLAFFDEGALVVEQLLVRALGEEAPMLEHVRKRVLGASMLVSFNGKSFDMPLLRTRFVMARTTAPPEPAHLDLVHVARRIHKRRGFPCRLVTIEERVLGFQRIDDVPSGEVSACYLHFLRTGETGALLGVIEHNLHDVVTMAALVGLYGEPLAGSELVPDDLAGASRVLSRAGAKDAARAFADRAIEDGGGADALRASAEIAKARGDRARALKDFQAALEREDDPKVRLELAKLYEHHERDLECALKLTLRGTSEAPEAESKRKRRLHAKLEAKSRRAEASAPLFARRK